MLALLQNEMVLYTIIVVMVLAFAIYKTVGFKRFFGFFRGSKDRVETARANAAEAATEAPPATEKA